jgi:hypothetical protein
LLDGHAMSRVTLAQYQRLSVTMFEQSRVDLACRLACHFSQVPQ